MKVLIVKGHDKNGKQILREEIRVESELGSSDIARCFFRDIPNLTTVHVVNVKTKADFFFNRKDLPAATDPFNISVGNRLFGFIVRMLGFKKEFYKLG